jgi:hypothetical protein
MLQRILFGYAGAIFLPIVLLPVAVELDKLYGHNAVTIVPILAGGLGLLLGFVISDWKRQFAPKAILMRTIIAFVVLAAWYLVPFGLLQKSPFISNTLWFIIPSGPLLTALASEFVFRRGTRVQAAEKKPVGAVETDESRPKKLRSPMATALCLLALDTLVLGSPSFAGFTLAAIIFWKIPWALMALRRKELFRIRMIEVAIYSAMVVASFSAYAANNHLASTRSDEVVSAVDKFYTKYQRYPHSLQELVPEYINSIPWAKYTLVFGRFYYNESGGKPYLMYHGWPPFERRYYDFASKRRMVID